MEQKINLQKFLDMVNNSLMPISKDIQEKLNKLSDLNNDNLEYSFKEITLQDIENN